MTDRQIPKIIHYCWFGGNPKSKLIEQCIASWKKYCPDWEIDEWNEDNFDISCVPYMKEAYEATKWAFVSDVARLMIIYQSGGVYMDTDVELLDSIDPWIESNAFFAFESNRNIASGLGFGATKGHKAVKAMLDAYCSKHFTVNGKNKMIPCPGINTDAFRDLYVDFIRNGDTQQVQDVLVLSYGDYTKKAIHHGTGTWIENHKKRKGPYKDTKLKHLLRNYKIFDFIEHNWGKSAISVYTFIAYDFLEMGVFYYIRRLFMKIKKRDK